MRIEKLTRLFYSAIAIWVFAFFVIFGFGKNGLFQILRGFFWPLLTLLITPVFIILSLIALFKEKGKAHSLVILLMAAIALGTFKKHSDCGAWLNFYLHKSSYGSLVKKVLIARDEEERKGICGSRCNVYHEDDVVSLSFPFAVGFLNWSQIIYDPIGIPRAKKPGNLHPNPPYDTYLVSAKPLAKDWYICHFID